MSVDVQRALAAAQIPRERLGPARTARLDEGDRSARTCQACP